MTNFILYFKKITSANWYKILIDCCWLALFQFTTIVFSIDDYNVSNQFVTMFLYCYNIYRLLHLSISLQALYGSGLNLVNKYNLVKPKSHKALLHTNSKY